MMSNARVVQLSAIQFDQRPRLYSHCAPRSDGSDTSSLFILGGSKLLVMGMATRNVASTFNESKQIAYALYSTCFTLAVILPITLLLGLLGDSLVMVVALGLWWVAFSVLACVFFPKLADRRRADR